MQLILISGLSGSGKSVALHVLEDSGYYCVDNLPAPLLPSLVNQLEQEGYGHVAVAVDTRAGPGIAALPALMREIGTTPGREIRFLFLDARDDILIQRFSETRRRHPLADRTTTLAEAIIRERQMLETLAGLGHRIDTSDLRPNALRGFVRDLAAAKAGEGLTLLFESFGYKHGLPLDADLVFDVRCLPNPHYDPELRPLTGLDKPVVQFLASQPEVGRMAEDIRRFVADWLPSYIRDNRSYLTVAIGCTGGQHRSVYLAEWLRARFSDASRVLVRHRSLAG
ncbi:MAG: RNase adapter RapZ [Proteobacteria bacterium]|nr:RNase adapter RapZ [Pseudomonadota bacterium]HQR04442.1 RNase adapter RapZ [Rhodocyclaceae bacterium]